MTNHPLAISRRIAKRIEIRGRLIVETPTHLGNGDTNGITDMPLLLDERSGNALLPGTSIAGALRSYVRERLRGYTPLPSPASELAGTPEGPHQPHEMQLGANERNAEIKAMLDAADRLFGSEKRSNSAYQSLLIIDDALSRALPADWHSRAVSGTSIYDSLQPSIRVELRDGVRIDPQTRTAHVEPRGESLRGFKYDMELLAPGTTFALGFELLLPTEEECALPVLPVLAMALDGLMKGDIGLGLRKKRGYGRCSVRTWTVESYNLDQPKELLSWLAASYHLTSQPLRADSGSDIAALLRISMPQIDIRRRFILNAEFQLRSSLLIRAGFDEQDKGPDAVHLHSTTLKRGGDNDVKAELAVADAGQISGLVERRPVLSGTSLAGALRARSRRILNTIAAQAGSKLAKDQPTKKEKAKEQVDAMLDRLFGPADPRQGHQGGHASRLTVHETVIENVCHLVQSRIQVDRFTGGAHDSSLFSEQPVFSTPASRVFVELALSTASNAEIGLLLLLLKDLWTGDLALGGESSVGRGRLQGISATMHHAGDTWTISQPDPRQPLIINGQDKMEHCLAELRGELSV